MALLFVSARAEAAGKRIGVPEFEGAQESMVRMRVMQVLQAHGFEVVRARDMQEAMALSGAGLDSDDDVKSLAKELRLAAIVTGEAGPRRAKIVVRDGAGGSILGDASFSGANARALAVEVGLTFWKKLGPDVERGHAPAGAKKVQKSSSQTAAEKEESAPEGESGAGGEAGDVESEEAPSVKVKKRRRFRMEEAPPEEAPEEAAARSLPPGDPWLDLELGVGGLNRSLTFDQTGAPPGSKPLRSYSLGLAPLGVARLVGYPWMSGKVGNFGVEATIQQAFGISPTVPNVGTFHSSVHEYAGGLRYRVLFATADDVFFSLTVGEDAFTFNGPNRSMLALPDTVYRYTRVGMGMHLTISDGIGISFGGGYRHINNSGGTQISQGFPHLTVAGADANLVARYALSEMFELRAGLEWRRYWFAPHSQIGDLGFANSGVDQSFVFTAGIAVLLGVPSAPKTEGGAEPPPPPPPPKPSARPGEAPSDDEPSVRPDGDSGEPSP